jgi:hypothetical protein
MVVVDRDLRSARDEETARRARDRGSARLVLSKQANRNAGGVTHVM